MAVSVRVGWLSELNSHASDKTVFQQLDRQIQLHMLEENIRILQVTQKN